MKLTGNPEVVRIYRNCVILTLLLVALAVVCSFAAFRHMRNTALDNLAAITGVVVQSYPDAEREAVRQITAPDPEALRQGREALSRYGIDSGLPLPGRFLESNYLVLLGLFLLLALAAGISFALLVMRFLEKQYGEIHAVGQYARKVSNGDFSLDIRDNREGEISILKNDIYKITTMLKEQAAALERDKIALADSLADISHQLKTPLTSMLMLNDLLADNPAPEIKEKFHQRMKSQLNIVEWLVSSLLTLSKLDAGTLVMKKEPVLVRALVDRVLDVVSVPLEIKRQEVIVTGAEESRFSGDFNWSCEALINILKNCIEYTPEKGQIKIAFAENPIFTEITVADSGMGIDQEDLPYIFKRFYKGKNAADDSVGIGLAMARALVARQGGDITVQSEKGRGSLFTMKFFKV